MKRWLDGWHRIGIVLLVIGFGWLWILTWQEGPEYLRMRMDSCERSLNLQNGSIRDEKLRDENRREYNACVDQAILVAQPKYAMRWNPMTLAVTAIYAVTFIWAPYMLVVWGVRLIVWVVRWVARGFKATA